MSQTGSIFVLSAPSGAGKSTLAKRLVAETPGLIFSTSFTTRKPRPGEQHGREYFFVDDAAFDRMMKMATTLAGELGGDVVDDNRAPFGAEAAAIIRSQIGQFQSRMADHDIPAGSPLALRLFSL